MEGGERTYRSRTQFFHDREIQAWIERLGDAAGVTIYAGAGLTIDKTGSGWARLIEDAISKNDRLATEDLINAHGAELITSYLLPIEAATIAQHYYAAIQGGADLGRRGLLQQIQTALYPGSYWQEGALTSNVMRVATTLASAGVDTRIVTTNYETHIEDQYRADFEGLGGSDPDFPGLRVFVLDQQRLQLGPTNPDAFVDLVYLHGRIPQQGEILGHVGLTEEDYYTLRAPVTEALEEAFRGRTVVIAGASLTDPPLLAALKATVSRRHTRMALTPLPGYGFFGKVGDGDLDTLKRHLQSRMLEFGVDLFIPDFFYQTAQFFQEVLIAHVFARHQPYTSDTGTALRYGGRLLEWWDRWDDQGSLSRQAATRAHRSLKGALDEALVLLPRRPATRDSANEPFELQVWVRWEPTDDSRCLALWATSKEQNRHPKTPTREELSNGSLNHAMQSFIAGRPLRTVSETTGSVFSVPIVYDHEFGPVPVGAVTLRSEWGRDRTRLNAATAETMLALIDRLEDVGVRLLTPGSD